MFSDPARVANTREQAASVRTILACVVSRPFRRCLCTRGHQRHVRVEPGPHVRDAERHPCRNAVWHAAGLTLARLENVILPRMKAPSTHD
jgi:hypothetical protein